MTKRQIFSVAALGMVLAFLIGFVSGETRRLSVDLWLVLTTVWLGWLMIREMGRVAPVRSDRFREVWLGQRRRRPTDGRPAELVRLEGLLLHSLRSERATRTRLRPRLARLCDHVLLAEYGVDRPVHPEQAARLLADVAWLADPQAEVERPPTELELEQLLAIVAIDERNGPRRQQG